MFTVRSIEELAGFFAVKAREMNLVAQQRTGSQQHYYNGQAHAYNDAAITIRNCKLEQKSKGRKKDEPHHTDSGVRRPDNQPAGGKAILDED